MITYKQGRSDKSVRLQVTIDFCDTNIGKKVATKTITEEGKNYKLDWFRWISHAEKMKVQKRFLADWALSFVPFFNFFLSFFLFPLSLFFLAVVCYVCLRTFFFFPILNICLSFLLLRFDTYFLFFFCLKEPKSRKFKTRLGKFSFEQQNEFFMQKTTTSVLSIPFKFMLYPTCLKHSASKSTK